MVTESCCNSWRLATLWGKPFLMVHLSAIENKVDKADGDHIQKDSQTGGIKSPPDWLTISKYLASSLAAAATPA